MKSIFNKPQVMAKKISTFESIHSELNTELQTLFNKLNVNFEKVSKFAKIEHEPINLDALQDDATIVQQLQYQIDKAKVMNAYIEKINSKLVELVG
jgi:hypothetical protein